MNSKLENKNKKISLLISSTAILILSISPFLLYLHTFIPVDLESYETLFGIIGNGGFGSIHVFSYIILNKLVPLIILILLYITNTNWWSNVILIPIATYLFQLIAILVSNNNAMDEVEFIYVIPFTIVILIPLYIIRTNLGIYLEALDLKKEMDDKINAAK